MTGSYEIRLIRESDAAAVLDIYRPYVTDTIVSFEYEPPGTDEFLQRIRTNTEKYPWLVCLQGQQIVGYAYGSTHRYRTAYQWSPESTIYLAPAAQGRGIGRVLYEALFDLLRLQGYYNVFAGIGLPNEKSVGLHRALGFEEIGIFRKVGYKHGAWHDTQWLQLTLIQHTVHPPAPRTVAEVQDTASFQQILDAANQKVNGKG